MPPLLLWLLCLLSLCLVLPSVLHKRLITPLSKSHLPFHFLAIVNTHFEHPTMAVFNPNHPIIFVIGLLGNVISFLVYLAPLPTFIRVYKKKSTESFHSLPYISALFSAMLWLYYGVLKPGCIMLVTINTIGCVIETLYLVIFVAYATLKTKMTTARLLVLLNMGVFGCIIAFTVFFAHGEQRILVVGWISSVTSVIVYAAPLSILRLVVLTKSVEFMPFYLSFFLTLNATVWFSYGMLIHDKFVALPNVLGFFFGIVQMGLYLAYRKSGKNIILTTEDKSMNNGHTMAKINAVSCEVHPIDIPSSPSSSSSMEKDNDNEINNNKNIVSPMATHIPPV